MNNIHRIGVMTIHKKCTQRTASNQKLHRIIQNCNQRKKCKFTITIKFWYRSSTHHSHHLNNLALDYQNNGNNTLTPQFQSPNVILELLESQGDNEKRVKLSHPTSSMNRK